MTRAAIISRLIAPLAEKITVIHRERQHIYGRVFNRQLDRRQWREHWGETFLRMATEFITPTHRPRPELIRPYLVIDQKPWEKTRSFLRANELAFPGFAPHIVRSAAWDGDMPEPFQGTPYCVVNISAHNIERQWSPERCAATCRLLLGLDPDLRIFISGSPADREDLEKTAHLVGSPRCQKVELKLAEFISFVAGAKFVITPDTATLHIAAAARRPTVGLFAEDIKACEWYPYGTEFVLLVSPTEESINLIEPEEIARATTMLSVQTSVTTDATIRNSL
jgi:ADP-heptose:LPS heptosyltransferase